MTTGNEASSAGDQLTYTHVAVYTYTYQILMIVQSRNNTHTPHSILLLSWNSSYHQVGHTHNFILPLMNPLINCTTTAGKGSKQKRCGRCYGCRAKDCGVCLDKKKFGGPNRLKQCCIHKKCAGYKDMVHKQSLDACINICVHVHGTSHSFFTIQKNAQTTISDY